MNWNDLESELDGAVFEHLSDDRKALWDRGQIRLGRLAAIVDRVERPSRHGGLALLEMADVVRLSVAEALVVAPSDEPSVGDTLTVGGRLFVIHGQPWKDEKVNGRDWLCPVNG